MIDQAQADRMTSGRGFLAALDQSGGSTPGALALYGVPASRFDDDDEMLRYQSSIQMPFRK